MDPKNPKSLWVESLFDVSEPYLYMGTSKNPLCFSLI